MKHNGFTLVELLAVIVLLGLIIVIASTNGFGAFNKAKAGINKIEEDNLLEAAKSFLVDVDNELCSGSYCDRNLYVNKEQEIEASYIIDDYMNTTNHCDGSGKYLILTIEVDDDGNTIGYSAKKKNETDIICSN